MKVLILSPRFNGGGAERAARELFQGLSNRGIGAEMWVAVRDPEDPPEVRRIRFPGERWLYPLNYLPTPNDWRQFGSIWRLRQVPDRFDMVHVHNAHGHWLSIRALRRLCTHMPVVWTLHDAWSFSGGMPHDLSRTVPPHTLRAIERNSSRNFPLRPRRRDMAVRRLLRSLPQPSVVITPSQYLLGEAERSRRFGNSELTCIRNPVSLLEEPTCLQDRVLARQRFNLPPSAPVVLMVAADMRSPYKGIGLGVQALQRVATEAPDLHVLLLGRNTEPVRSMLKGSGAFPVATEVRDPQALAAAYRAADVTLVPSIADTFPYVPLESLACETPPVAFGVGGIPEIVGQDERGLLADALDTNVLADRTIRLLHGRDLAAQLGKNGRKWVERECGMNRWLDATLDLYDRAKTRFSRRGSSG